MTFSTFFFMHLHTKENKNDTVIKMFVKYYNNAEHYQY